MKDKVIRLIELTAERESLALKAEYLKGKNDSGADEMLKKLKVMDDEIHMLSNLLKTNNIEFYLLNFDALMATERLNEFPVEQRRIAVEQKAGNVYELIKTRLTILRQNVELKNELANALVQISAMEDKDLKLDLLDSIRTKRPVGPTPNDPKLNELLKSFARMGIYSGLEQRKFVIMRDTVWLDGQEAKKMDTVLAGLTSLEPALQWKNAQRQIKVFDENEENEFLEIQKKYLELLVQRDALVDEYKKKETVSVK